MRFSMFCLEKYGFVCVCAFFVLPLIRTCIQRCGGSGGGDGGVVACGLSIAISIHI